MLSYTKLFQWERDSTDMTRVNITFAKYIGGIENVILIYALMKRYVYNSQVTNGDTLMHSYIHYRHSETSDLFLRRRTTKLGRSVIQRGEHAEKSDINRIALKNLRRMQIDSFQSRSTFSGFIRS